MKYFNLALGFVFAGASAASAEADITVNSSRISVWASFSAWGEFAGTTIPTHTTLNPMFGEVHNNTTIDWYQSAGQTILSHDVDQQRAGTYQSFAETSLSHLDFTANSNEPYKLS